MPAPGRWRQEDQSLKSSSGTETGQDQPELHETGA